MTAAVRTRCPAKLNLTLAVGLPDRSDLGRRRHPVVSLMAAVDFGDTLELAFPDEPDTPSTWSRVLADDAPRGFPIDWPLETDLAFRAHAAVETAANRNLPVHATLTKRVPPGTGLGAGSADAAAVLVALQQHLAEQEPGVQPDVVDFTTIAAELGADVAFARHALLHPDQPAAIATGFGETLEPIALPRMLHAALLFPDAACPTAEVYRAFDRIQPAANKTVPASEAAADPTSQLVAQLQAGQPLDAVALSNDLTDAAFAVQPKLAALFAQLRDAELNPHLTGSGAAVFLPAADADHAADLASRAHQVTGHPTRAVQTMVAP